MLKFLIKNSKTLNILMILIYLIGAISLTQMPLEDKPPIDLGIVVVSTVSPGYSAIQVEKLVTKPLEDKINGIKHIDRIKSQSRDGISSIVIEFNSKISPKDAFDEVAREVSQVNYLPSDVEKPTARKIAINEFPIIDVIIGANTNKYNLKTYAENLQKKLEGINGVSEVNISGVDDKVIKIIIDKDKLFKANLSISDIENTIRLKQFDFYLGKRRIDRTEYILNLKTEIKTTDDILDSKVMTQNSNKDYVLRDFVKVIKSFKKKKTVTKFNNKDSISLSVVKFETGDTFKIVKEVKKVLEKERKNLPKSVLLQTTNDNSYRIKDSVDILKSNAVLGIILVFVALFFFLDLRSAFFVFLGIPFSFFSAMIYLKFVGMSLNTVVLFGFILVLGIVVDDAIIVVENIYKYLERGYKPFDAAYNGAREVIVPVMSSFLTTIAAFFPLMFMTGKIGKFLGVIPLTVISVLIASLFESFVILASHIYEHPPKVIKSHENRTMEFLKNLYSKIIDKIISYKYIFIMSIIALFIFSLSLVPKIGISLVPEDLSPQFYLNVELNDKNSVNDTAKILDEIVEKSMKLNHKGIDSIVSTAGKYFVNNRNYMKENAGIVSYNLHLFMRTRKQIEELQNRVRDIVSEYKQVTKYYFNIKRKGPSSSKPVELKLQSKNLESSKKVMNEMIAIMKKYPVITDISDDLDDSKMKFDVIPDESRLRKHKVSLASLRKQLQSHFDGFKVSKFFDVLDRIDIVTIFSDKYTNSYDNLQNLLIQTNTKKQIKLKEIAEIRKINTITNIRREAFERTITLSADIDESKTDTRKINKQLQKEFKFLEKKYSDVQINYKGGFSEVNDSLMDSLKMVIIAVMLIYLILVTQFKSYTIPFIIMFTIPFAIIGVLLGLYLFNMKLSMPAIVGIIGLIGVVVNDSIILIDFIYNKYRKGDNIIASVKEAGLERLRPILLTSITTITGLVPLAFGIGGTAPMWQSIAIAFVFGLTFSTILTLFVVPCLIVIKERG